MPLSEGDKPQVTTTNLQEKTLPTGTYQGLLGAPTKLQYEVRSLEKIRVSMSLVGTWQFNCLLSTDIHTKLTALSAHNFFSLACCISCAGRLSIGFFSLACCISCAGRLSIGLGGLPWLISKLFTLLLVTSSVNMIRCRLRPVHRQEDIVLLQVLVKLFLTGQAWDLTSSTVIARGLL